MTGYIEPICEHAGIIRLGPQAFELFDQFDWSVFVQFDGTDAPVIKGLTQTPEDVHFVGVGRVLWAKGFRRFKYYRVKRKQLRRREFQILNSSGLVRRVITGHTVSGSCVDDAEIEPQRAEAMNKTTITISHVNPSDPDDNSEVTVKLGKVDDAKRASIDADFLAVLAGWNKASADASK